VFFFSGIEGKCESRSTAQADELKSCIAAEKKNQQPDIAQCYRLFGFCFAGCRFPTQICNHKSVCNWKNIVTLSRVCVALMSVFVENSTVVVVVVVVVVVI
jgi:hypothetical protein